MPPSYTPLTTPRQMNNYASNLSPWTLSPYGQQAPMSYEQYVLLMNQFQQQQQRQQGINPTQVMSSFGKDYAKTKGKGLLKEIFGTGSSTAGASTAATAGTTFQSGATFTGQAVGSTIDGGTLMSTGEIVPASEGVPVSLGAGTGETAAGAFDLSGIGSAGNGFLPAAGLVGEYDLWKNKRRGVRGHLQGAASGAAIGSFFGPEGALIGAGVGALQPFFMHESTRDVAKRHTQELEGASNDPTYRNYLKGTRTQYDSAPPDPSKPFHGGQYRTWNEYRAAGLDPNDLTGVFGNINAYGPKWSSLTEDQRRAVTKKNIDSGLYNSKKGEVLISNDDLAQKNFQDVINANPALLNTANITIPKTHSPGFDKNGRRIRY